MTSSDLETEARRLTDSLQPVRPENLTSADRDALRALLAVLLALVQPDADVQR